MRHIYSGGEPAVACPKLGFNAAAIHDDAMTASWLAFQQQSGLFGLRAAESCPPTEWEDRCPPGATMLLAEKRRGGCRAAGCIAAGGELNDVRGGGSNNWKDKAHDQAAGRRKTHQRGAKGERANNG
ncbi:unnamed protein product [Ectocarpus sp. CCAP 1310/34]|nr:unnamed protein product [Ectocarpus sp. CCAP 1310/34]